MTTSVAADVPVAKLDLRPIAYFPAVDSVYPTKIRIVIVQGEG
jgi:hypothetical protein